MVKLAKRGTCSKCGKGPRKLINGLCQHECVKKSSTNEGKLPKGNEPPKECHSCKQQEGAGPALNWISCSNPTCRTWYHSVCTDLGESTKKALAVVFWLCPKCVISVKPIWVNINADPEALNRNDNSTILSQLSGVMEKLVKDVVPKLVQDALEKRSDAVSESNRNLESEIIDTGYHRVLQESSERHKRRCNIIIKGLQESPSEVGDDRKAFDASLFESISNLVGLQEKPVKIMRLGAIKENPEGSIYCRPMRVVFCREDPVIELLAKRNVKLDDKMYWFNRDLTQNERKLEFEARKKRRERLNASAANVIRPGNTGSSSATSTTVRKPDIHNIIGDPDNNK